MTGDLMFCGSGPPVTCDGCGRHLRDGAHVSAPAPEWLYGPGVVFLACDDDCLHRAALAEHDHVDGCGLCQAVKP